jgi:hypothetical protein
MINALKLDLAGRGVPDVGEKVGQLRGPPAAVDKPVFIVVSESRKMIRL